MNHIPPPPPPSLETDPSTEIETVTWLQALLMGLVYIVAVALVVFICIWS